MRKKDILLLVMSIIAVAYAGIILIQLLFTLIIALIPFIVIFSLLGFLEDFFVITIFLINILILGILGLICVFKHIYASGCLIYGGIFSLLSIANIVFDILGGSDIFNVGLMICLMLYTAGAAIAYIDSRNDKKERIENNNPYPF